MQKACHPHLKVFTNQIIINQIIHHNFQASWTDGCMRVGSTSGSLPPVPPNVRSVRRSDVLVEEHCGLVTYAIIKERLSLENLSTQFT